jgi:hypothetical protein
MLAFIQFRAHPPRNVIKINHDPAPFFNVQPPLANYVAPVGASNPIGCERLVDPKTETVKPEIARDTQKRFLVLQLKAAARINSCFRFVTI